MKKEDKQEITLGTSVRAVITGYIAYGILVGFIIFIVNVFVQWCIQSMPNPNYRTLAISLPLIAIFFLYFIIHGICKLSVYDVFKKCKTNPENLPKIATRLNLFIMICIAVYVVGSISIVLINFSNEQKDIAVSAYQYSSIHSEEFAKEQTDEMLAQFSEEKTNTIISTVILELGVVVSLFTIIPYQKKMIEEYNEF